MNFETWLINIGKSARSAKSYSIAISGVMSSWAKEASLIEDSLIQITSPRKLNEITPALSNIEIFIARNTKGKGMYSSALKAYAEFLSDVSSEDIQIDIDSIIQDQEIKETEKSTLISARVGQGKFRNQLIDYWNMCSVTGFSNTRFLVASHIKPWRDSNHRERLDRFNGLLLLPNIDKAFDKGYVTFEEKGRIMLSPELEQAGTLGINSSMTVSLQKDHHSYMSYHREEVYKK
jgi:predicted restriction endonuclease